MYYCFFIRSIIFTSEVLLVLLVYKSTELLDVRMCVGYRFLFYILLPNKQLSLSLSLSKVLVTSVKRFDKKQLTANKCT